MPAILLLVGLIIMFIVISLLNAVNKNDPNKEPKELNIQEDNASSCQSCGHTGACQHKIF